MSWTSASEGYEYTIANPSHTDAYLVPVVLSELGRVPWAAGQPRRVIDVGCGTGATAALLAAERYAVTGVEPSASGVAIAARAFPQVVVHHGSCYDDLAGKYGRFPVVVSLEVVEHVFFPRKFAKCVFDLLEPGGMAILSTPYHGYWKNLVLAVAGKWDRHLAPLWDNGHIKFWSPSTLTALLAEAGLHVERIHRVGRIPVLAKSMVAVARRSA
jgi:2-polyprenyl-6-hydroxyphenyl methylase/3-demethylubiquinone-9 3-methyltransferase